MAGAVASGAAVTTGEEDFREVNSAMCSGFSLAFQVYLTAGKTYRLEKTLKELEEGAQHSGTTDSELSELEDKVASAAAQVQQAESEVRA